MNYHGINTKVQQYNQIQDNTKQYRNIWKEHLRSEIEKELTNIIEECALDATIEIRDELDNLEAIALSLGRKHSGIAQILNENESQAVVKNAGALVYQQLFNGKIMISIFYPVLEGLSQPKPPKMVEILRPEELKIPFITRHVEEFLKEMISWEDFDDDAPSTIGFHNHFQPNVVKDLKDKSVK